MNVLVGLPDPRFGGPQKASLKIAKRLLNKGVNTEFLLPHGGGEFVDLARNRGFVVHQPDIQRIYPPNNVCKNFRYLAYLPKSIKNIQDIINAKSIDVVNARSTVAFQTAFSAAQNGTPLVWHFNDVALPRPFADIAAYSAIRYADEIVVSAQNVVDHYFNSEIDITKIYPLVDQEDFDPDTESYFFETHNINEDTTKIGLIGNINPLKGYRTFIDAYSKIYDEFPNCEVLIVGKQLSTRSDYYNQLQKHIAKNGLKNRVYFLGWQEDIPGFLSSIDLFVMPSHSETGPMTLIEAMMMEKPIVTTNVGVVPEQLEHNKHAWIVDPDDSIQLANAIRTALLNREQWGRLGESAQRKALSEFDIGTAAKKYKSIYESALQ